MECDINHKEPRAEVKVWLQCHLCDNIIIHASDTFGAKGMVVNSEIYEKNISKKHIQYYAYTKPNTCEPWKSTWSDEQWSVF